MMEAYLLGMQIEAAFGAFPEERLEILREDLEAAGEWWQWNCGGEA